MRNHSLFMRALIISLCGMLNMTSSSAAELSLADRPLLSSNNVPPNILVAVDDSGSMDWETLFPTDDALLYWNAADNTSLSGSNYIQNGSRKYGYLFPNGAGRKGQRVYTNYLAIPPIPQFAFARSSAYNKAYFDPTVTYAPWLGYDESTPTSARYDPNISDLSLNLREIQRNTGNYQTFDVTRKMDSSGVTYLQKSCFLWWCDTDWVTDRPNSLFSSTESIAIEYFPATFYMPANWSPPSSYGWKHGAAELVGYSPDDPSSPNMKRYEIKPGNFAPSGAYEKALQNFANWFTFYRKRHLATRAGIATAFDNIDGARVGARTINEADAWSPPDLKMLTLNKESPQERQEFYSQIFNTDFYSAQGTPNRPALKFLGNQLETNPNIIQSSCQRNFAILFTDGYNNAAVAGIRNADQESKANKTYGAPFGDRESNTIADVAMHYYENLGPIAGATKRGIERNQLRVPAGCGEDRPDPWLDCNEDLHMVTLGVTLGQTGKLFDPTSEYSEIYPYENPPDWTQIHVTGGGYGSEQIDDLWHATINSRGKLLNARTPQEIAGAFTTALEKILYQDGSLSGVVADSRSLSSGSSVFQASYKGGSWQGELVAYQTTADGIESKAKWSASKKLSSQNPDNRTILTSLKEKTGYVGTAFNTDTLRNVLGQLTSPLGNVLTSEVLAYLRGNQRLEESNDGSLRNRYGNILGDIVQSTPAYVGKPQRVRYPSTWIDHHLGQSAAEFPENKRGVAPYTGLGKDAFTQNHGGRSPMIYVGANDGMLHGFQADTGAERLAYIPGTLLGEVADLAQPDYSHRYYVDGTPVTGDAVFDGAWHTVLVSGLNNGGNAIFALDVTDPGQFSEASAQDTVLWEYTDDVGLGQTYGKPSIVRLHNGKWATLFGNGYNSKDGSASLYLLDIGTGTPIRKPIVTYPESSGDGYPNGLSAVTPIDVDGDFITDYVYAGDLYGNIWRFDLTSKRPSDWTVAKLFTARAPGGGVQPITMAPEVGIHSYGKNYGVMVYFGTGKYLENTDALRNKNAHNSFYGVWDRGVFSAQRTQGWSPDTVTGLNRSQLASQSITEVAQTDESYRVVSDRPVTYRTSDAQQGVYGWVLDMPTGSGELLINSPSLNGDIVTFSTMVPAQETCDTDTSGWQMAVRADTGGRTDRPTFDLNGDFKFTNQDFITVGNNKKVAVSGIALSGASPVGSHNSLSHDGSTVIITGTSDGGIKTIGLNTLSQTSKRLSWREIRR